MEGEPGLTVAASGLRIAAVKRAAFIYLLLFCLRNGEGQGVRLLSNFIM